jgi:hypothetical protein
MNYVERKAHFWARIKDRGLQSMVEGGYQKATPEQMEDLLAIYEGQHSETVADAVTVKVESNGHKPEAFCSADCSKEAGRYVQADGRGGWEIKPFGKVSYMIRGPRIKFCPFCGKRMKPNG